MPSRYTARFGLLLLTPELCLPKLKILSVATDKRPHSIHLETNKYWVIAPVLRLNKQSVILPILLPPSLQTSQITDQAFELFRICLDWLGINQNAVRSECFNLSRLNAVFLVPNKPDLQIKPNTWCTGGCIHSTSRPSSSMVLRSRTNWFSKSLCLTTLWFSRHKTLSLVMFRSFKFILVVHA